MKLYLNTDLAQRYADAGLLEQERLRAKDIYRELAAVGEESADWGVTDWLHCEEAAMQRAQIADKGKEIRENADVFVLVGVGGSNQAARAMIEALDTTGPQILYAGNTLSAWELARTLQKLEGKSVYINVIAKNFETLEPSSHFRVLRRWMSERYTPEEMARRVVLTGTYGSRLEEIAKENGYLFLSFPERIGGRYSAFSPVSLLALAVAGLDVEAFVAGGSAMEAELAAEQGGIAAEYAALRSALGQKDYAIEMLAAFEPRLFWAQSWWKQLFGESEGKDNKGLMPTSVVFSTDLHSMGQFVQEGARVMFETVVNIHKPSQDLFIEADEENLDGLNFLANQNMSVVNEKAMQGTILAHTDGDVPNIVLETPSLNEYDLGYLIYFFERACAISGYLLSVNPFDQPGVESYKKNMFALLGKPGYEDRKAELEAKLG